ncbi:hypothetical protein BD324DRAFT_623414 [Kockovaella imperatae]|uniref:ER membrane protein complex subunit 6 n=1 Tax=Kockovaella imperatae TaxID=4999 RepID=A0A1Y1UID1_9TREE|nr:hypothetical protein BD324DRAFT_623414 [Kockovaella imperatae]ORX37810.1 hypothetical protein BD324DRAFT_623414 [Kockovaella imperatae]
MDPSMAGPQVAQPPVPGAPAPGDTSSTAGKASPLFPPAVQHNVRVLSSLSTLSACFSGLVAGVLGLQNYTGFLLYLLTAVSSALVFGIINCHGNMGKYVAGSHVPLVGSDRIGVRKWRGWVGLMGLGQENFLGFLLFWIGGYALIHVYD